MKLIKKIATTKEKKFILQKLEKSCKPLLIKVRILFKCLIHIALMCCSIMSPPCEVGASKSKHERMELNNKVQNKKWCIFLLVDRTYWFFNDWNWVRCWWCWAVNVIPSFISHFISSVQPQAFLFFVWFGLVFLLYRDWVVDL